MRLVVPILFGLLGTAVLVAFGVWQLQRAEWKDGILAQVEARLASAPVPLPADPDPDGDLFLTVELDGRIAGAPIPVFGTWRGAGAGYKIVVPVETGGRRVLVDLGVAASADPAIPTGEVFVIGNLNWPDETEASPESEVWTSLDLPAMAERAGTEPVLITARETLGPAIRAVPLDTAGIPDNHMGYAVQWFGLAAVWAGMAGYFAWRTARGTA